MQVQGVNTINNNYNTNFKAIKELRYKNHFVPNKRADHERVVQDFLDSKGIKEFAKKYDFIAEIDVQYNFDDIYNRPYRYILNFLPATDGTTKNLPLEFTVIHCKTQYEYEANNILSVWLKNIKLSEIEEKLNSAITEKNYEPPREKGLSEQLEELDITERYV